MKFYVVMALRSWTDLKPVGLGQLVTPPELGDHFLCVFTSEEEAKKHWPDKQIVVVERDS